MIENKNIFDNDLLMKKFKEYESNRSITIRNKIIEMSMSLVKTVVEKYFNGLGIELDDIVSLGNFGLIKAVESYDPDYGSEFEKYATKCILNYIKKNMHTLTNIKTKCYNYPILKSINIIEKTTGVSISNNLSELDDILSEDIYIDDRIKRKIRKYLNCDVRYNSHNVKETYEIEEDAIREVLKEQMMQKFEELSLKERRVLELRYGFYGNCHTLDDIADYVSCTHQNVSLTEARALNKLRQKLKSR